jgi:triacylglycerol lipase
MSKWWILLLSLCGPVLPVKAETGPPQRVVFVHGIWQNEWRSFGAIRHAMEAQGIECLAPSLKPCDGSSGLPDEAAQLKAAIDERFGDKKHFTLIAFSMGGLASRYYLQDLGGAKRCDRFITVSTPHHGTGMAWFYWGKGARQMRPGSEFLKELEATEDRLGNLPVISYRTKTDMVIIPSVSSIWDRAENVTIKCPMHQMMTGCPALKADLFQRLRIPLPEQRQP